MLTINGRPRVDSGLSVHNVKPEKKAPPAAKPKAKAVEPIEKKKTNPEEPKEMKKKSGPKPAETAALDRSRSKDKPKRRPIPGAETRRAGGRR